METTGKVCTIIVLLTLLLTGAVFAEDPPPQASPPGSSIASGVADLSGTGGKAYVEYEVWDGGNGWYYYTYQICNTDPNEPFTQYVKHLWITNPTGEYYFVTSSSGGYQFDEATGQPTDIPGDDWSYSSHISSQSMIKWEALGNSNLYPGKCSWDEPKFQFASQLPPAITGVAVRQGDYLIAAYGLIAAPGLASINPRSPGYWKHQAGTKGKAKERDLMEEYLNTITSAYSTVFDRPTIDDARNILDVSHTSDMRELGKRQLLALWLNVVSGKLQGLDAALTFEDPLNQTITKTVGEIITEVESAINNPAATQTELEYAKDLAEIVNLL